jgi:hypothetical protein
MSRLNDHAWLEFKAAGWLDEDGRFKDDMQEAICLRPRLQAGRPL